MWSRKELKENAKVSLKANYWKAFLASLITAILGGGFAASRRSMTDDEVVQELKTSFGQQSVEDMAAIIAGLATIVFVACIISFFIFSSSSSVLIVNMSGNLAMSITSMLLEIFSSCANSFN